MPTKQETFDAVVSVMLEQGARSVTTGRGGKEMCRLRGDGGLKSPAGTLIPDEHYTEAMEDVSCVPWRQMFHPDVEDALRAAGHDVYFVWRLESIHVTRDIAEWPALLRSLARSFGLDESYAAPPTP